MWENVLEDPSTWWNRPRLIYDPVFQNFKPITFVQCISFFSLSFYFIQAHRYQRRSITADDPQIWFFFYAKQQNWCLVFALKTKTTTKQTKYSTICGAWYNLHNNNWYSKISLHGFQNLWKKCAIFLFNKPSHLIENWW